jgi:hypothetical protein
MNKYAGEQTLALNVHTSTVSLYRPRLYPVERFISSSSVVPTFTFPICSLYLSFRLIFFLYFPPFIGPFGSFCYKQLCINIFPSSL